MNVKPILTKTNKGKTNWDAVKLMTEEDINAAAKSDPDAQPLTKEKLKSFPYKIYTPPRHYCSPLLSDSYNTHQLADDISLYR